MWITISLIFGLLTLLGGMMYWAYQNGKQNEQLERLKREVKERARANEIVSNIINLNHDELTNRMHAKREASKRSMSTKN